MQAQHRSAAPNGVAPRALFSPRPRTTAGGAPAQPAFPDLAALDLKVPCSVACASPNLEPEEEPDEGFDGIRRTDAIVGDKEWAALILEAFFRPPADLYDPDATDAAGSKAECLDECKRILNSVLPPVPVDSPKGSSAAGKAHAGQAE